MKLSVAAKAMALLVGGSVVAMASRPNVLRGGRSLQQQQEEKKEIEGTYLMAEVQFLDGHDETRDAVELPDGQILDIEEDAEQSLPPGWQKKYRSGEKTKIKITGTVKEGKIKAKKVAPGNGKKLGDGTSGNGNGNGGDPQGGGRRRLALTGTRTVLALRANAADVNTTLSESQISDDIFGTGTDPVNLRSQYNACSHNQLDFEPVDGVFFGETVTGGVYTVSITNTVAGSSDSTIRNAMVAAGDAALGTMRNQFHHVMVCVPKGTSGGWIGYAYTGSSGTLGAPFGYLSVYNDNWCRYTSIQMHEIGHNLKLAHAGEGTAVYADQSGFMGYSYSQDDHRMCFNAVKNWQLGWFEDRHVTLDISTPVWSGKLFGPTMYSSTLPSQMIIIRIHDPACTTCDVYVSFNHKDGTINSQTAEAGNKVLVHTKEASPGSYKQSWLMAKLGAGQEYLASVNGKDISIIVNSVNTAEGYADVEIGCSTDADCEDGNMCTSNTCNSGVCESAEDLPVCATNSDFCDGSVCDPATGGCFEPCDDNDMCTDDVCNEDEDTCQFEPIFGCSKVTLACGSSGGSCSGQTLQVMPDELHEVRCCSDVSLSGWNTYSTCAGNVGYNVWGESEIGGQCYHAETHASAAAICEVNQGRLCTVAELLGDCTRGSGCSHDSDMIWSSEATTYGTMPPTGSVSPTGAPTGVPTGAPVTGAPTSGSYYLACGSSDKECSGQTQVASPDELHEVRCCSETNTNWHTYSTCAGNVGYNLYSQSYLGAPGDGCYHGETYASAVSICVLNGARLCTKDELLGDCTRGSGCQHDWDMIWSSTPAIIAPSEPPSALPTASPITPSPSGSPSASPSESPVTDSPTGAPITDEPSLSPSEAPTTDSPSASPSACKNHADCSDGVFCNGEELCIEGACAQGTEVNCDDDSGCTINSCDETSDMCVTSPACSAGETCVDDSCVASEPSSAPSSSPSKSPSQSPVTSEPSSSPSKEPITEEPSKNPSQSPVTPKPSSSPSKAPITEEPSKGPSQSPVTSEPSSSPTTAPITEEPSKNPSRSPVTSEPSSSPSKAPTTEEPSKGPSQSPVTSEPSSSPSKAPTTEEPSKNPSQSPVTSEPSSSPTKAPITEEPSSSPSRSPSGSPVQCTQPTHCDDGIFCNGEEFCDGGECFAGTKLDCNDDVSCTIDFCNETSKSCENVPSDAQCADDGFFCNGVETCDAALGCQSSGPPCATGETCDEDQDICDMLEPTGAPTAEPSSSPSKSPSRSPVTDEPSSSPSKSPSRSPATDEPSSSPSKAPTTEEPSSSPSKAPGTDEPSSSPSKTPSRSPNTSEPSSSPTKAPTDAPTSSAYYLACGSSAGSCSGQKQAAEVGEEHEVRCCSDEQKSGWYKHSNCPYSIWGESDGLDGPRSGCWDAATYGLASKLCAEKGGRLCTADELLSDCTRGSGCSHDQDMIWSSDPVVPTVAPTDHPTVSPSSASPTETMQPTLIGAVGETGRIPVSDVGSIISTRYTYVNPVVVAFINTRNGDESVDVRVKDVARNSFRVFLEEAPGTSDPTHTDEDVSYIVMEEGWHELEGGLIVQAGLHSTSRVHRKGQSFIGDQITFTTSFAATPAVLTTLNTYNNAAFMSSLTTTVNTGGFQISQEALETQSPNVLETIGWMAFSTTPGVGTTSGGSPYIATYAAQDGVKNGVDQTAYSIDLTQANFTEVPDLVVQVYGEFGTDGSYARGAGTFTTDTQTVYAEEDITTDSERQHASEPFAWVGFHHNSNLFSAAP